MSSAVSKEKARIFETILSSPGMNEKCKLSLVVSRQSLLLLCRLMEAGLLTKELPITDDFLQTLPSDSLEEIKALQEEMLRKAGLADFYQRIKTI